MREILGDDIGKRSASEDILPVQFNNKDVEIVRISQSAMLLNIEI